MLGNGPHACIQFINGVIHIMGRLSWVICLSWQDFGFGNGRLVLGNGPHMLCNGPHVLQ